MRAVAHDANRSRRRRAADVDQRARLRRWLDIKLATQARREHLERLERASSISLIEAAGYENACYTLVEWGERHGPLGRGNRGAMVAARRGLRA
jgi:hypothetical protein